MIKLFDTTLPCGVALLEYSEGKNIQDFDLSIPLNLGVISGIVRKRTPDLVPVCEEILTKDKSSGLMFDSFLSKFEKPAIVSFKKPEALLGMFDLSASLVEEKTHYATVLYLNRDNEIRIVYRDPQEPDTKTNIHDKDGLFLYKETQYKGTLPSELDWAVGIQSDLLKEGIKAQVNHYKINEGYPSKVYFKILP
jgi:hypothetical protein